MAAGASRNLAYAFGPGDRIGRHMCVAPLAMGGMAELYVAQPSGASRDAPFVVIKRALPHLAQDAEFAAMLLKEARLASGLHHPNVTRVLAAHEEDGLFYMVLEYVHGYDLRALIRESARRGGAVPLGVAIRIATAVCEGLQHAHDLRDAEGRPLALVHRDVTPANVLLGLDGRVLLTDFGIARALTTMKTTRAGVIKGKLGYMSPEQCRDGHLDRRSDLFSVGVLIYEMTTGYRMFNAANDFAVMNKITKGEYVPPGEAVSGYPSALAAIVQRCVAVDPDDRYATAADLAKDLAAFARAHRADVSAGTCAACIEQTLGRKPLPAVPVVARAPNPKPRASGMAAALVLGVVAGGALVLASGRFEGEPIDPAASSAAAIEAPAAASTPTADPPPAPTSAERVAASPLAAPAAAPPGDPTPAAAAPERPEPEPARRRKRVKRRAKPDTGATAEAEAEAEAEKILPPSMRGR